MEDITRRKLLRTIDFTVISVLMIGIIVGLATLTFIMLRQSAMAGENWQEYLVNLAVVSLVLTLMSLVVFGWIVMRYLSYRLTLKQAAHKPTEYVDAWALAGKRFKLPDGDDPQGQDKNPKPPDNPQRPGEPEWRL